MDTFLASSCGTLVMLLFQHLLTAPSWQTFALLASGWALASGRHTIATYLWLTGATTVKHFSRFSVFLGCPFYHARWQVWACLLRSSPCQPCLGYVPPLTPNMWGRCLRAKKQGMLPKFQEEPVARKRIAAKSGIAT